MDRTGIQGRGLEYKQKINNKKTSNQIKDYTSKVKKNDSYYLTDIYHMQSQ